MVRATGVLIDDTLPQGKDSFHGIGASVMLSARLLLAGSRIVGSHTVGMDVRLNAVSTSLFGLSVERTKLSVKNGTLGAGAWFHGVGGVQIVASRFVENRAAALIMDGSEGTIDGSVVSQTSAAKFASGTGRVGDLPFEMADGILVRHDASATIRRNILIHQPRAGALVQNSPKSIIGQSVAAHCGFGLALLETDGLKLRQNLLYDNDQNIASDALQVPPAPDLAKW